MPKNSFISSFRKLPAAFLCSIALFFISQALLSNSKNFWRFCYYYSRPMYDDALRLEAQLKLIPAKDKNAKVFLIGSSQTREDFDTKRLNQKFDKSGLQFYNLGFSGAAPIEIFMLKDRLLQDNPKIIVYVPFVGSFYSDYKFSKMKYYFNPAILPYLIKYFGLKNVIQYREYLIDSLIAENSLLFKYRVSLPRIIFYTAKDYFTKNTTAGVKHYAYSKEMNDLYFKEMAEGSDRNRYTITPYTKIDEALFTLFAEEVKTKGVELVVIDGPTHPMIKEFYKKEVGLAYNAFLKKQAEEIGFVYLEKESLPDFNAKDFVDFTHLNETGRIKLTRFLENYLSNNKLVR